MTLRKRRQQRVDEVRRERASAAALIDPCSSEAIPPPGAVLADPSQLAHNNTYGLLPRFYIDRIVVCRQCGVEETWPAHRQKWWYEVAKGNINTQAALCRACRASERERRDQARRAHLAGVAAKQAPSKDE